MAWPICFREVSKIASAKARVFDGMSAFFPFLARSPVFQQPMAHPMSPWQPFPAACALLPVVWTTDWPESTHFKIVIQMSKYIQRYVVQRNTSTSRSKMAKNNTYFLSSTAGVAWAIFSSKSGACMRGVSPHSMASLVKSCCACLVWQDPAERCLITTTFPISQTPRDNLIVTCLLKKLSRLPPGSSCIPIHPDLPSQIQLWQFLSWRKFCSIGLQFIHQLLWIFHTFP